MLSGARSAAAGGYLRLGQGDVTAADRRYHSCGNGCALQYPVAVNVEAEVSLSAICVWATITMLSVNRHFWIDFRCPSADTAFKVFHPGYSCAGKERQHLRGTYSGATHEYVLMCAV